MSETSLIARQRTLLADLAGLTAARAAAEPTLARAIEQETAAARHEFDVAYAARLSRYGAEKADADRERQAAFDAADAVYAEEKAVTLAELAAGRQAVRDHHRAARETAQNAYLEARVEASARMDGGKAQAEEGYRIECGKLQAKLDQLQEVEHQARKQLIAWRQPESFLDPLPPGPTTPVPRRLPDALAEVRTRMEALQNLTLPNYLTLRNLIPNLIVPWLALTLIGAIVLFLTGGEDGPMRAMWLGIGSVALAPVVAFLVRLAIARLARNRVREAARELRKALDETRLRVRLLTEEMGGRREREMVEVKKKYNRDLKIAAARYSKARDAYRKHRGEATPPLEKQFQEHKKAAARTRAAERAKAEKAHAARVGANQARFDMEKAELEGRLKARVDAARVRHENEWKHVADAWLSGMKLVVGAVHAVHAESDRRFPAWGDAYPLGPPGSSPPAAVRFGSLAVGPEQVRGLIPADPRLHVEGGEGFALPALMAFPSRASVVLDVSEGGRDEAVAALQMLVFRLLTALPAGKVRLTMVDPLGLGQHFASFMNLSDWDEQIVGGRIWTETAHIDQRLADLTGHMENVIQKYLRNRFIDIAEYNAHAGEVAEAFRFLVVANFPHHFNHDAARRLLSIAQSGPRCGVFTLLSVDTRQSMPQGFHLDDLRQACLVLTWRDGRFVWDDEDFAPYPLTLDAPPEGKLADRLLQRVGEQAKLAGKVEVPFEFIAPAVDRWWTGDSRSGIDVPLGRAGATRRQHLRLGQGTSQHVLIAGKTGSGKSTLLHALVTNLSLMYSPDEIELYLIDFKKGVEFKTYATHEFPHARVVAVESEREFGLSVLQRLDAELKKRGERFRHAGVQDVAGFRAAEPGQPMPRVVLVVDEFQEFFVEDDRIAQESAQLLDRLVRQGRAFGLHILLGSQTLGGAYSLARSTIDQMAVRIALQCSEADAQMILSPDNSAARLLSRPGEAIYNDANGLVEGNNPFQVVWLADDKREDYLKRVRAKACERTQTPRSPLVFEGNALSDVSRNVPLRKRLLAAPGSNGPPPKEETAWLGEALALEDLTAVSFKRQHASNLLVVGQQEETARGMLATAVLSLAAGSDAAGVRFHLIDGYQPDTPADGVLARLAHLFPNRVRAHGWRATAKVLTELSEELDRRQRGESDGMPTYLVVFGLQRIRELRRAEDDFGFGRPGDDAPSPPKQLVTLLREGPVLGLHVLAWCDTVPNVQRIMERAALREFGLRVAFQMSVADSSTLIESPFAAKLGMHRALLSHEDEGRLEKFRPYGLPADEWLEWVRTQTASRPVESGPLVSH